MTYLTDFLFPNLLSSLSLQSQPHKRKFKFRCIFLYCKFYSSVKLPREACQHLSIFETAYVQEGRTGGCYSLNIEVPCRDICCILHPLLVAGPGNFKMGLVEGSRLSRGETEHYTQCLVPSFLFASS